MKIRLLFLASLVATGIVSAAAWADAKKYTLQDLQALEKRKAWDELLTHLQDVPPSERGAAWNRVVESACTRQESIDSYLAETCYEPLRSVLTDEPENRDFAWKAAKWLRRNAASHAAVPYFAQAGLSPDDARCKDKDLLQAILSGLGLPKESHSETVRQSQALAFQQCWPATKDTVLAGYNEGGYKEDNSCVGLKKKGLLGSLASKKCTDK